MIKYRKEMNNVKAYIPGKNVDAVKREYGLEKVIKLASNENPLGTSEKVITAIKNYVDNGLSVYPDGSAYSLKEKLSKKFNLEHENILITNGGDDALAIIALSYLSNTDEVITSQYSFIRYSDNANLMGAKIIEVPMIDHKYNLQGILDSINEKTKLIWFCNPNNPTGTIIEKEEVLDFFSKVPDNVMVIYDEAYSEFSDEGLVLENSKTIFKEFPNVVTIKTFSKIYGLAGIRIGYITAAKEIIEILNKARLPFNVNAIALLAAEEALDDEEFIKRVYDNNLEGKKYLYDLFESLNLPYLETQTNHIFFETPSISAKDLFVKMQKLGVIIRPQYDNFTRVSIGTMEENKIFGEKLREVLSR